MPHSADTVTATWVGPAGCQLNGQELVPGHTTTDLPAGEAAASDNWRPPAAPHSPSKPEKGE